LLKINFRRLASYAAPMRLAIFILVLLLLWLPVAAPIYLLVPDSNLVSILTLLVLYGEFIALVKFWGKQVHREPQIFQRYGLQGSRRNGMEWLAGLGGGLAIALSLFIVEGWLGWLVWRSPTVFLPKLILEGWLSAVAIGFAEELLFRGWLLDELERDYRPSMTIWATGLIFALLHFIKPLAEVLRTFPQFPGLILLGIILVWAKRGSGGRLGLSMGLHGGLVWGYYIINVGQLTKYSGQVPDWLTGVDRNPLAGVMGLLFLSAIAWWMRQRSIKNSI
jgi:membrane protease YdiL (CAAX protease family)